MKTKVFCSILSILFILTLSNPVYAMNTTLLLQYWVVDNINPIANVPRQWADSVIDAPAFLRINNSTIYLYVEGYSGGSTGEMLGLLASYDDGLTWKWIADPIPDFANTSQYWSSHGDECCPTPVLINGTIYLFYCSHPPVAYKFNIGVATSTDGVNFTPIDDANPITQLGTWDNDCVFHPTKPILYNGTWYMYYTGRSTNGAKGIGLLITSENDFPYNWTKVTTNAPLWSTGVQQGRPKIIELNNTYYMIYRGSDGKLKLRWSKTLGTNWSKEYPVYGVEGIIEMDIIKTKHGIIAAGVSSTRWDSTGVCVGILKAALVNVSPSNLNINTYINKSETFFVKFSKPLMYNWYIDNKLYKSGFSNDTNITINFNTIGEGNHKISLEFENMFLNWSVNVINPNPKPKFTLKPQTSCCKTGEKILLKINITNIHELRDYEIYIDLNSDGIPDIITKDFNVTLPPFSHPAKYKITIYVKDPVTGAINKSEFYLQVYSFKLFKGYNIINTTGAVILADSTEPAHVEIKPIKVTKEFTVVVSKENIYANNTSDIILNVTFIGLAGGDKLWLNETVANALSVDLLHNGEPILTAIPVVNGSVNLTLTTFSTYTLIVNNTISPSQQPAPEEMPIEVFAGIAVGLVAVVAGAIYLAKRTKAKTLAKMENEFRFFKRLK